MEASNLLYYFTGSFSFFLRLIIAFYICWGRGAVGLGLYIALPDDVTLIKEVCGYLNMP